MANDECPQCRGTGIGDSYPNGTCRWCVRQMSDEELLEKALYWVQEQHELLNLFHRRHGGSPAFEDVCCRAVASREITTILAEKERIHTQQQGK